MNIEKLNRWFLQNRRDFPWREEPTPYRVWVSEVMLQQTKASVVIPYFLRWMERFPTIEALAFASEEAVIKEWEGLGYYSRARRLHEGAKYIMKVHGGVFPSNEEEMQKIKGLGPYTIGALRSFAFHQRAPAVDGNVLRVMSRLYQIEEDIAKAKTAKKIRQQVGELLPQQKAWVTSEALIELGATVCKKRPLCPLCPLQSDCQAHLSGKVEEYPVKKGKVEYVSLFRAVGILFFEGQVLLRQGKKGEVMEGLYEFPYFELSENRCTPEIFREVVNEQFSMNISVKEELKVERHTFTKYRVRLFPYLCRTSHQQAVEGYQWERFDHLHKRPFSSGHKRILSSVFCPDL